MKVRFRVTKKDINDGKPGSCSLCPIALSMKRRGFEVAVGVSILNIPSPSKDDCYSIYTKPKMQSFISEFDNFIDVKPFQFTLEIPAKFVPKALKKRK